MAARAHVYPGDWNTSSNGRTNNAAATLSTAAASTASPRLSAATAATILHDLKEIRNQPRQVSLALDPPASARRPLSDVLQTVSACLGGHPHKQETLQRGTEFTDSSEASTSATVPGSATAQPTGLARGTDATRQGEPDIPLWLHLAIKGRQLRDQTLTMSQQAPSGAPHLVKTEESDNLLNTHAAPFEESNIDNAKQGKRGQGRAASSTKSSAGTNSLQTEVMGPPPRLPHDAGYPPLDPMAEFLPPPVETKKRKTGGSTAAPTVTTEIPADYVAPIGPNGKMPYGMAQTITSGENRRGAASRADKRDKGSETLRYVKRYQCTKYVRGEAQTPRAGDQERTRERL